MIRLLRSIIFAPMNCTSTACCKAVSLISFLTGSLTAKTMSFSILQKRLREEGWYVGWNLPCCQSCAWAELPFEFEDGSEIDLNKVLFNHSQDCEVYLDGEECPECDGCGCDDEGEDCLTCYGKGVVE